jgi:hypothetical protein
LASIASLGVMAPKTIHLALVLPHLRIEIGLPQKLHPNSKNCTQTSIQCNFLKTYETQLRLDL